MAIRISLLSIRPGGSHRSAADDLAGEYLGRCGRDMPAVSKVFRSETALLEMAAAERRSGAASLWLADLGGVSLSSEAFAERIRLARDGGLRHLMLAIGPANGWSVEARAAAELRISLGPMTLPHELARLVLAEQIYRANTILQGHPYHLGH